MVVSITPRIVPFLFAAIVVLTALAGCSGDVECISDADCPEGYECAAAGGVFASDSVCLPEADDDAGLDANDNAAPDPSCDDGQQSGQQTDVDCGGPNCPPCEVGHNCLGADDCVTNLCVDGVCQEPNGDCPPGQHECGSLCVDRSSHDDHCGSCDNPCEGGEICDDGVCICEGDCCFDDDCDDDERCDGGVCVCHADCCADDDCAGPEECEDGSCICPDDCCHDGDCPGSENCIDGSCECIDECCADEDCPGFEECDGGSCVCDHPTCCSHDDCAGDLSCSFHQECIEVDDSCDHTCDCAIGYFCTGGSDGGDCVPLLPGPSPHNPYCCASPFSCPSGEGCTWLDGSIDTCP